MILDLLRKDQTRSQAETLYAAIAAQARAPEFYRAAGAPDTTDGRFDLLTLHMILVLRRLRREEPETDRLSRALQEVFFRRLDDALREMGVGDLSVGRKIRGMAEAFYGRAAAYERAFAGDEVDLAAALARNIHESADAKAGEALAAYARNAAAALDSAAVATLADAVTALGALSAGLEMEATDG